MRSSFFVVALLAAGLSCADESSGPPPAGDGHGGDALFTGDEFTGDQLAGDAATLGDAFAGDAFVGGGDSVSRCSPPPTTVIDVSVADLKSAIDAGETIAIIDVREPSETDNGIIAGALLYPYSSGVLATDHANLPTDRPLYIHCHSGGRSAGATAFLVENGHNCVHDVQGGMSAWTKAGYPTVLP